MPSLYEDLSRIENLPVPVEDGPVQVVSTHGSHVFLTRHDVFKVKRAKNFGFLEYSTLEKRARFCKEEVRLNRRAADGVYLGVLEVTLDERGHSIGRTGQHPGRIVDHAVHMRRLPEAATALARLEAGRLGIAELQSLAVYLAGFYASVERCGPRLEAFERSVAENFEQGEV
ncbi:MAG TPA: hypothetical protein PKE00_16865, partial [Planctomycetota bacterium]|nr:hypothetical protein [Planctomycetota bacterium]